MIKEVTAKSVLRKRKHIDSWFMTYYGLNLYRGCTHNCVYCDGRAESYRVEGNFGTDIEVKKNAIELLAKEMNPARKRKPMPQSFMMLGGGVCDAYQPIEEKYRLARQTLELIEKYNFPVHILTKSTLVERDLDIIKRINYKSKAIVSFSLSSADDKISNIFEPGVPAPTERLKTIKKLKSEGVDCGIFLMPVLPLLTDNEFMITETLSKAKEAGINYVIYGTMTLKEGRQKEYFMPVLEEHYPDLAPKYKHVYTSKSEWGESSQRYNNYAHGIFDKVVSELHIPKRIPPEIYKNVLNKKDQVVVMLQHLDYILKLKNQKSPYGYAAHSIQKMAKPLEEMATEELLQLNGVGKYTVKIIREFIETEGCEYYENLLIG